MVAQPPVQDSPLRAAIAALHPQADYVLGRFYERLLTRRPDFAPYFANTDWTRQKRMLLQALVLTMELDEEPATVEVTLRAFGHRHDPYPLTVDDYRYFGDVLRETLREHLRELWTPAVDTAWDGVYPRLVGVMRGGA